MTEKQRLILALELMIMAVGFICIWMAFQTHVGAWQNIWAGTGVTLTVSMLATVWQRVTKSDLVSQLDAKIGFKTDWYDIGGLRNLYSKSPDNSFFDGLNKMDSVDILINSGVRLFDSIEEQIEEAILRNGAHVRVLLGNPSIVGSLTNAAQRALSPSGTLLAEIEQAVGILRELERRLIAANGGPKGGCLQVKHLSCIPHSSLIILDKRRARSTAYLPYRKSTDSPTFDVTEGTLLTKYQSTFDGLWQEIGEEYIISYSVPIKRSGPNGKA